MRKHEFAKIVFKLLQMTRQLPPPKDDAFGHLLPRHLVHARRLLHPQRLRRRPSPLLRITNSTRIRENQRKSTKIGWKSKQWRLTFLKRAIDEPPAFSEARYKERVGAFLFHKP